MSYYFAGRITRPIILLNRLTQRVGAGDLSARVDISTGDEVENLADSFNLMTESLMKSRTELDEAHKKLVEAARNAGMAEVATGILHNAGNVLNSVGVTTSSVKERVNHLKMLFEKAGDAIFIIQDGVVKFANPGTLKIMDYSMEELTGILFTDLIQYEERDKVFDMYTKKMQGKEISENYFFRVVNKRGSDWLCVCELRECLSAAPAHFHPD